MNIKKTLNIVMPFVLLVVLFGLIIHSFFDITKVEFIKYILSQVFVIMTHGLVCTKYIIGNREKSVSHWIPLGYVFGYSINILEYILIWSLNLQRFATPIVTLITVLVIFFWFYKPIDVEFEDIKQNDYVLLFIFMVFMIINIITYSGNNISPFIKTGGTTIPRDVQFWCSNAVSLKNSFLPQSAYFSGTTFFYHYFSSMHIAFLSQVTGISVFDLSFTFFSFGKCVLLIGAINYLIDRYAVGSFKYLFYLFILFMTGWEMKPIVTYGWHLNYNPFGFDIGFAFGLWFLALVMDVAEKPEFDWRQFIGIMLIWTSLSGLKGPIAVLLILVPGLFCFIWLFQKKYKIAFGYGLTFIGIFSVVSIVCVGIIRILNHTAEAQGNNTVGFRTIYEVISGTTFPVRYRYFIPALIWYAFYAHPALFIVTVLNIVFLIWMIIERKVQIKDCIKSMVLILTAVIGVLVGIFYIAGGRSEMYFFMASYIPCFVFILESYHLLCVNGAMSVKWKDVVYKIAVIGMSIIGLYCWGFTDSLGGIISPLSTGYNIINGGVEYDKSSGAFSKREADVCAWIRDNTPQNSIVQSNRFISYPTGNYYVAIFSERVQYLEETFLIYYCDLGIEEPKIESRETVRRSEIIAKAFEGDKDALNQLKEEGVDYLMQDNLLYEDKLGTAGLKPVHIENDIILYELD